MTKDQLAGVLQVALAFAGSYVPITFMPQSEVAQVVGAIVAIAMAVWSHQTTVLTPPAPPAK